MKEKEEVEDSVEEAVWGSGSSFSGCKNLDHHRVNFMNESAG